MASACFDTELTGVGILRLLEAIPTVDPGIRFNQADRARLASGSVEAGTTAVPPT
jgi:hypothetical protein